MRHRDNSIEAFLSLDPISQSSARMSNMKQICSKSFVDNNLSIGARGFLYDRKKQRSNPIKEN